MSQPLGRHHLFLYLSDESTIDVAGLWRETSMILLDELAMDFGISVDKSIESRGWLTSADHHSIMWLLKPAGVGAFEMTVNAETKPHWVLFALLENVMTEHDYAGFLEVQGKRFAEQWNLSSMTSSD